MRKFAMLASASLEGPPVAVGRRVLTALIAVAMAFAPVGAASATPMRMAQTHQSHAMHHHDHGAMQMATMGSGHCHAGSRCCCCDKAGCAQSCLQKCFGQLAVIPPQRTVRIALAYRVAPRPAERPPGWSSAPQLPPPRA
jgi:hypothetical protein